MLSEHVPEGLWFSVTTDVVRNQSFRFTIDGRQVSAFTYAQPYLNAAPTGLLVGGGPSGTFGGSVQNVVMAVNLYGQRGTPINYALRRVGQLLGAVAIGLGIILLARRWLSRLIPVATSAKRPLVLVTFGTMGVLIAVNVISNLLQFQPGSDPNLSRNTWLFTRAVRFSDFLQVFDIFKSMDPYRIQLGSYPPIGYWLVAPVAWMNQFAGLFVFLAVFVGFMIWWCSRSFTPTLRPVERVAVVVIAFGSLPVTFAIDRANVDLWVFIMLVFGIAALERKRGFLAASWLGLAAAAKILPAVYLFVFLRRRRWRYLWFGIAIAGAATVVALIAFDGTLSQNITGFRSALSNLEHTYNQGYASTYYNSSIFGWAQSIGYAIDNVHGSLVVRHAIEVLVVPGDLVGAVILGWYLYRREQSLWRAVTLITLWMLLLPDVAYYYEMLFLFIPLALFVKHASVSPRSLRIGCFFGLILAPKTYFYFGNGIVDSSVLVTAPLLLALAVYVVRDGILERREPTPAADGSLPARRQEMVRG